MLQGQHALQHPDAWPKDPHLQRGRLLPPLPWQLGQLCRQPLQQLRADEAAAARVFGQGLRNLLQVSLVIGDP